MTMKHRSVSALHLAQLKPASLAYPTPTKPVDYSSDIETSLDEGPDLTPQPAPTPRQTPARISSKNKTPTAAIKAAQTPRRKTDAQVDALQKFFEASSTKYPSPSEIDAFSHKCDLTPKQVSSWFTQQRRKLRDTGEGLWPTHPRALLNEGENGTDGESQQDVKTSDFNEVEGHEIVHVQEPVKPPTPKRGRKRKAPVPEQEQQEEDAGSNKNNNNRRRSPARGNKMDISELVRQCTAESSQGDTVTFSPGRTNSERENHTPTAASTSLDLTPTVSTSSIEDGMQPVAYQGNIGCFSDAFRNVDPVVPTPHSEGSLLFTSVTTIGGQSSPIYANSVGQTFYDN
ncbi:hypothetical protein HK097_003740, partial [Rhizophlyctis rosea]